MPLDDEYRRPAEFRTTPALKKYRKKLANGQEGLYERKRSNLNWHNILPELQKTLLRVGQAGWVAPMQPYAGRRLKVGPRPKILLSRFEGLICEYLLNEPYPLEVVIPVQYLLPIKSAKEQKLSRELRSITPSQRGKNIIRQAYDRAAMFFREPHKCGYRCKCKPYEGNQGVKWKISDVEIGRGLTRPCLIMNFRWPISFRNMIRLWDYVYQKVKPLIKKKKSSLSA